MHEQGIAQEMVTTALRYGAENRARRITKLHIELSQIAHENEDSLQMYLEHLARGTIAEDAKFNISRVAVLARCVECGCEFEQHELLQVCPRCGTPIVAVKPFEEIRLTSIEIE
jgi:hydrogenase nickel incorporation protein HypA/HybF